MIRFAVLYATCLIKAAHGRGFAASCYNEEWEKMQEMGLTIPTVAVAPFVSSCSVIVDSPFESQYDEITHSPQIGPF